MKRTQLQLDDPVYEALRRRAYDTRTSIAGVVREALKAYLVLPPHPAPRGNRPVPVRLPSFVGSFRSDDGALRPVSERHDEALALAFWHGPKPARRPRR
ncbi:MAG: CopG family transcriptional regulator [Candidatus Coatesbacteria bacterium]